LVLPLTLRHRGITVPKKKLRINIYLWSIRLEQIQYMDYLFYNLKTEHVTVTHTWMKSEWFKHKKKKKVVFLSKKGRVNPVKSEVHNGGDKRVKNSTKASFVLLSVHAILVGLGFIVTFWFFIPAIVNVIFSTVVVYKLEKKEEDYPSAIASMSTAPM